MDDRLNLFSAKNKIAQHVQHTLTLEGLWSGKWYMKGTGKEQAKTENAKSRKVENQVWTFGQSRM